MVYEFAAGTEVQGEQTSKIDDSQKISYKSCQESNVACKTKFHFMRNQIQSEVLEVVHYSTYK